MLHGEPRPDLAQVPHRHPDCPEHHVAGQLAPPQLLQHCPGQQLVHTAIIIIIITVIMIIMIPYLAEMRISSSPRPPRCAHCRTLATPALVWSVSARLHTVHSQGREELLVPAMVSSF